MPTHDDYTLFHGDCFDFLPTIPEKSVDLVLTDPPYNIGVKTKKNGKAIVNEWDRIGDGYVDWCIDWLNECSRVLKPQGVLYFWHNDMVQVAELMEAIRHRTPLVFRSFCIWDKGDSYRARSWKDRQADSKTRPRCWFNVCEYCLHYFNTNPNEAVWYRTGMDRVLSNPENFRTLKQWYDGELKRLGITPKDIARKYTEVTGKKPYMLRHYFQNSQFEIPTREVYDSVYVPLGFSFPGQAEALRQEYEALRQEYEAQRQEYEAQRNLHRVDFKHCNIWHMSALSSAKRFHTCQKPVPLLRRLIRVSCPDGGVVLDPFMGSGSTGVACVQTGRKFIGVELDIHFFDVAKNRLKKAVDNFQYNLFEETGENNG